jgi:small subunit ribosomal protein S4
VNGHKVDIASYNVQPGDEIEVKNTPASRQLATRCLEENRIRNVPGWLTMNPRPSRATRPCVMPTREEMSQEVNEQLIVEFYSRF